MPDSALSRLRSPIDRLARVMFAFIVMNTSAVEALFAFVFRRKVWRR